MVSSFYPTAKLRTFLHLVGTKNTGVITIFSENEIRVQSGYLHENIKKPK